MEIHFYLRSLAVIQKCMSNMKFSEIAFKRIKSSVRVYTSFRNSNFIIMSYYEWKYYIISTGVTGILTNFKHWKRTLLPCIIYLPFSVRFIQSMWKYIYIYTSQIHFQYIKKINEIKKNATDIIQNGVRQKIVIYDTLYLHIL